MDRRMRMAWAAGGVLGLAAWAGAAVARPEPDGVCTLSADDPDCPPEAVGCGKALAARRGLTPLDETPSALEQMAEAMGDTDVLNNNLQIEIVPGTKTISGYNQMTVKAVTPGLNQFTFMLRSNYTISSVVLNEGTPGAVTIPGASVVSVGTYGRRINLDRAYAANEQFTVKVNYSGVAVSVNGSIEFVTLNAQTLVYSLSEPYYSATWWPCKDGDALVSGDNADKATLTLGITVPSTLKVTANGLLQGVDALTGSRSRYRFQSNIPMATYLVAFSAHPYNTYNSANPGAGAVASDWIYSFPGGTMPMEINISPGSDTQSNRTAWRQSITMMETLRPVFGLYPFVAEKYGVYQFGYSGGMEHQTNTGAGSFGESLVVHELTHQWWGDWVTCRTWNDIWINEGLATYGEAIWLERKAGGSDLTALSNAMTARKPTTLNGTVYVFTPSDFNRIFDSNFTYRKASWVFHMLRKILGETGFVNFLATMRATYGGSALTSADLQVVAETIYGSSLNWFFQPWLYQVGGPTYGWAWQNVLVNGQRFVEVYITQTQSGTWPTFTMPVEIGMTGQTSWNAWNDARAQWFLKPVSAAPAGVTLDPGNWILNGGKNTIPFVDGPPKVISVSPAPGSNLPTSGGSVAVGFHKNVTAPSAAFTLAGPGGNKPITVAYNAATFVATVTPTSTLAPGTYTLTIADTVTAGGNALDGEITGVGALASLPSGNGVAGGAATFTFTVPAGACNLADVTGIGGQGVPPDNQLTVDDVIEFINAYSDGTGCPGPTPCSVADVSGIGGNGAPPDGQLTVDDVIAFFNAFSDGC